MREIKFRGKRHNGEWIHGALIPADCSWWGVPSIVNKNFRYEVHEKTIGMYTGQKDMNGVEIYEGDILEEANDKITYRDKARMMVSWGKYSPVCNNSIELGLFIKHIPKNDVWRNDFLFWVRDGVKVIGNIFDNPELLKDGEMCKQSEVEE